MQQSLLTWADVQAIAFDLDGTLVDSIGDLAAAANYTCQQLHIPQYTTQEIQGFVGDGISRLIHRIITGNLHQDADESIWQHGFTCFLSYYKEHIVEHSTVYPQVETALSLFRKQKLPLVIITNKLEQLTTTLLKRLNLSDYFCLIIGGDTLPEKKPSAQPLQHTAEVLGIDVHKLLMVGDSANDLLAAHRAGCPSVGVRWGYADMDALAQTSDTPPNLIIDTLPSLFDQLNTQNQS